MRCFLSIVALSIFAFSNATEDLDELCIPEIEDVTSPKVFKDFILDCQYSVVIWYTPWCIHSKTFAKEFAQVATECFEGPLSKVKFGRVNCDVNPEQCEFNGVTGYPTIRFYGKGEFREEINVRTADEIINYLSQQCLTYSSDKTIPAYVPNLIARPEYCSANSTKL